MAGWPVPGVKKCAYTNLSWTHACTGIKSGRQKWWLISFEHQGVNNLNLRDVCILWRWLTVWNETLRLLVLFYKRCVIYPTAYTFVSMNTDSSVSTVFLRLPGDDFFSDIPVRLMFTKSLFILYRKASWLSDLPVWWTPIPFHDTARVKNDTQVTYFHGWQPELVYCIKN